jgi:hypothetical protein
LKRVYEIGGWDAFQGESYFQFRRDEIGTAWEMSESAQNREHEHEHNNVVGRGETIQDAANQDWSRARPPVELSADLVRSEAECLVVQTENVEISLDELVRRVGIRTGSPSTQTTARDVMELLKNMRAEFGNRGRGRSATVIRYNDGLRAAWRESDQIATALGGQANHYVLDDRPATISLSLETARALVARLGGS